MSVRVIMLTASFHPHVGGAERHALELSRFLIRLGAKPLVLTRRLPGTKKSDEVEGVPVTRLAAFGKGFFNSLSFLAATFAWLCLRRKDYDIIHVQLASSPALAACLAAKLFGKKTLIKVGGGAGVGEVALSRRTVEGRLKLRLLGFFRPHVTAVNREIISEMKAAGLELETAVFRNGVDTAKFRPADDAEKKELRKKLGISGGPVFIFTGRLSPEKRLFEFLKTWAELKKENDFAGAALVIAGAGPERGKLENLIGSLGIADSVKMTGTVNNTADYYRASDIFVLPSESEGLSNSMLEAMACGLAVMVSRVGGAPEALEAGKEGLLFDPFNGEQIKECALRLCREPGFVSRLGVGARRAAERYSMESSAAETLELYKKLLSEN